MLYTTRNNDDDDDDDDDDDNNKPQSIFLYLELNSSMGQMYVINLQ